MAEKKRRGGGCVAGCAILVIVLIFGARFCYRNFNWHKTSETPAEQQKSLARDVALPAATALKEGTGIVVIVDTSGSMQDKVADVDGVMKPKIHIARSVTARTLDEIRKFASQNPGKNVMVGLTRFSSNVETLIPMGPAATLVTDGAVEKLAASGNTAIGEALVNGKQQLNQAGMRKQHMIVITDGENTTGRSPEIAMSAIAALPEDQRPTVYLVAFDIQKEKFEPLVKHGVMVAEAQNEKSLRTAMDYILYEKILVEQE
jgi:Mg-chelatase subunit ChlD